MYTKAGLDSLMDVAVRDGFTDLLLAARPDTSASLWFSSSLLPVNSRRIDGLAPGGYLIREAHKRGVRVHIWWYLGYWAYDSYPGARSAWNLANSMDGRCNQLAWVNWDDAGARGMMVAVAGDLLAQNPGVDGIHFDYIRYHHTATGCPTATPDDVTAFLRAVRAVMGDAELSVSISGNRSRNELVKRDVPQWLGEGLVDEALVMSYTSVPMSEKLAYIAGLPEQWRIVPGVPSNATKAVLCAQVAQWRAAGFWDFGVFDSVTWTQGMAECFDN